MASEGDGQDDRDMKARLDSLAASLDRSRQAAGVTERERHAAEASAVNVGQAMSLGFRVLAEFVAGVAVGAFIGWQIDRWLGTSPGFLIGCLALGTAAGFWNVYRIAAKPTMRK